MKKLSLITLVAAFAMLTGVAMANIPAPPVNQDLGFPDVDGLGALTEADCRVCHDSGVPDRHHMLYGSTIPDPSLVPNPDANGDGIPDDVYSCLSCHPEDNTGGIISFIVVRDCTVCHTGDSPHHETADALAGDCVSCHGDLVDNFDDGHYIPAYAPSLVTPSPQAEVCSISGDSCADDSYCTEDACAVTGTLCVVDADCGIPLFCEDSGIACVDEYDCDPGTCRNDGSIECHNDGDCVTAGVGGDCRREEPCLGPNVCVVEGEPCVTSETPQPGGCNYCHDAGTDTASGLEIVDNHDTHHGASVRTVLPGETSRCYTCHTHEGYRANDIRKCEICHGPESLHNIQVDGDGDCCVNVGEEPYGYGHVGADDPGGDSDCWGCHGFSVAGLTAPGSGPTVPTITSIDPLVMTAGTATQVTVLGSALTNTLGALEWASKVVLTAQDGSTTELTPDTINSCLMTVTIPGSMSEGNYELRAVKEDTASGRFVISVIPAVEISEVTCSKCLGTMTITGTGFAGKPDGTDEDITVTEGGRPLNIISWTDTSIEVSGARCAGDLEVTTLFGSATTQQ